MPASDTDIEKDAQGNDHSEQMRRSATKARVELGWQPVLRFEQCIALTAGWYGEWAATAEHR